MSQGQPKCICFDFHCRWSRGGAWLAASAPLIGLNCYNATIHQEELSVRLPRSLKIGLFQAESLSQSFAEIREHV